MSSSSVGVGMLRERSISTEACMIEWRSAKTSVSSNVFLRSGSIFGDGDMMNEPVNQRGWTLQENLLSSRMLSYGSQQTAWECQECKTNESGRSILARERHRDKRFIQSLLTNRSSIAERTARGSMKLLQQFIPCGWSHTLYHRKLIHSEVYVQWYALIKEFCRRDLTVQSDVFPAISALAATFQNSLDDQYCAGLWRYDLIRGLLWKRDSVSGDTELPYELLGSARSESQDLFPEDH